MIPFSLPRVDQKIIDEVTDTLKSGWITTGPKTKRFEKELMAYTNSPKVFCCNSATNGLELLLRWLGIGPGDEVIVPAYTYCATANVILHVGATPVMVDVLDDFTIDPDKVEAAITGKTKLIVPVDLGGYPADYHRLWEIVNTYKKQFKPSSEVQEKLGRIALISDSAHSIGALVDGKPIGTQADAMVFSFHAVKNLTTAEGGAIGLNLPKHFDVDEAYNWLNTRSLHGQSKDALAKSQKHSWEYDVETAGWKCNMTDIQAAMGLVELSRYKEDTIARRREIVELYDDLLAKREWAILPTVKSDNRESSYHLFLLRVKGASLAQRNKIIEKIFDQDISVNVHYKPLPLLTVYKNLGYEMDDYPVSKRLWENEISLPIYYDLSNDQVRQVVAALEKAVEEVL